MHTLPWTSLGVWASHFDKMSHVLSCHDYVFHTSLTKPDSCINFSPCHNAHSWSQDLVIKFVNIKSCYSFSHVLREKCYIYCVTSHIWPSNMIITNFPKSRTFHQGHIWSSKMSKSIFFQNFPKSRTNSIYLLFLDMGSLSIKVMPMERVEEYVL
mgnify:CR=1 FL=1